MHGHLWIEDEEKQFNEFITRIGRGRPGGHDDGYKGFVQSEYAYEMAKRIIDKYEHGKPRSSVEEAIVIRIFYENVKKVPENHLLPLLKFLSDRYPTLHNKTSKHSMAEVWLLFLQRAVQSSSFLSLSHNENIEEMGGESMANISIAEIENIVEEIVWSESADVEWRELVVGLLPELWTSEKAREFLSEKFQIKAIGWLLRRAKESEDNEVKNQNMTRLTEWMIPETKEKTRRGVGNLKLIEGALDNLLKSHGANHEALSMALEVIDLCSPPDNYFEMHIGIMDHLKTTTSNTYPQPWKELVIKLLSVWIEIIQNFEDSSSLLKILLPKLISPPYSFSLPPTLKLYADQGLIPVELYKMIFASMLRENLISQNQLSSTKDFRTNSSTSEPHADLADGSHPASLQSVLKALLSHTTLGIVGSPLNFLLGFINQEVIVQSLNQITSATRYLEANQNVHQELKDQMKQLLLTNICQLESAMFVITEALAAEPILIPEVDSKHDHLVLTIRNLLGACDKIGALKEAMMKFIRLKLSLTKLLRGSVPYLSSSDKNK
jgi:hypothetical protein